MAKRQQKLRRMKLHLWAVKWYFSWYLMSFSSGVMPSIDWSSSWIPAEVIRLVFSLIESLLLSASLSFCWSCRAFLVVVWIDQATVIPKMQICAS